MKSKSKLLSLASLLSLTAFAAQKPDGTYAVVPGESERRPHAARSAAVMNDLGAPLKASDLIGMKIDMGNDDQKKTGRVDDLAIDLQAGRIVHVIMSTGGFLSVGDRQIAVPPSRVHFKAAGKPLHFEVTPDGLKSAPAFENARWKEFYESDRVQESYSHFGEEPAFKSVSPRNNMPPITTSRNGLGQVQKATKLIGLSVQNLQNDKIGSVENLVVDLSSGRVVAVIVSSGGFLGLGDTLSAIPPTALRFSAENDRLRLDTTKEALTQAPRFKTGEWPDFAQQDYTAGVYRAYQQEPYFGRAVSDRAVTESASGDVDNATRNVRDRGGRTLTPADQGNHITDVKITQQIRKAVTGADDFSVNAKNVKIITVGGRVTLRGPVRTAAEKSAIAEMAVRVAGVENVDNQLEIAAR